MSDVSPLLDALHGVAARVSDDASETDVENAFHAENLHSLLGYDGAGRDLRSGWALPDDRRPDCATIDGVQSVTAVYEFEPPGRGLAPNEDRLFDYVDELEADYGVLTDGTELRLYRRAEHERLLTVALGEVTESEAADLEAALRKPERDVTDPRSVATFLDGFGGVDLDSELGRADFFETFRLAEDSPFANLVTAMMDLLAELRDDAEATVVTEAYDRWAASYASEPAETPDSWEPFVDCERSVRDLTFCLESGHAMVARLLLAKAADDHDIFPDDGGVQRYFDALAGLDETVDPDAYPVAVTGMMEDVRRHLVERPFEGDVFTWWTAGDDERTPRQHEVPESRFERVPRDGSDSPRVSPAARDRFGRAVAGVTFAVSRFDCSEIAGDPLGDLYQRYFDPETRTALGEFYTPRPVVEYVMDGVGYDVEVSEERLVDPSCGSGAFLVEAVNRYLDDVRRGDDDPDWSSELVELCTRPHVVGLDVHPFAVLMARIRFVVSILPECSLARESDDDFTIRRLPVFRTDSLRNERAVAGLDHDEEGGVPTTVDAVTEDDRDLRRLVSLPVEADDAEAGAEEVEAESRSRRVRIPTYDAVTEDTEVRSVEEYYAVLQGVLDVVRDHVHERQWEYHGGLGEGIRRYTAHEHEDVEGVFGSYVDDVLGTVRFLREEHGTGGHLQRVEDSVLAFVAKNYMGYDYVVGNPPYVRIQHLPERQKRTLEALYESTTGNYDIYCPFYERGLSWLRDERSRLGYITSNQFMYTDYGEGLRRVLAEESTLVEVLDFKAAEVFEDAANLPAIVIASTDRDGDDAVRSIRAKPGAGREFDREVLRKAADESVGYSDESIDVFEFPQSKLGADYWAMMPEDELRVFEKLEERATHRVDDVSDAVFQGIRTSKNTVFVVDVLDADRVEAGDRGRAVTIRPTGTEETYVVESDCLRPFLRGKEVDRWRPDWSGLHVLYPYELTETDGEYDAELYSAEYMREHLPETWAYLESFEEELRARESGAWADSDEWYEFGRSQNLGRFEVPKIVQGHICKESTFMLDEVGTWYFTSAYGVLTNRTFRDATTTLAGQLNASVADYYIKHIASIKLGWSYEYRAQYVGKAPVHIEETSGVDDIEQVALRITSLRDTAARTKRFPEAYVGTYDGGVGSIDYVWQTRRSPVDAEIRHLPDGRFAVTAGRSDEITSALVDRGDHDERELRARYVHAAVDGREVKKNEEQTIPIPRSRDGVERLVEAWEADRRTVEATSVEDLEAEIDRAVYDLFGLTEDERRVVEDYLDVF